MNIKRAGITKLYSPDPAGLIAAVLSDSGPRIDYRRMSVELVLSTQEEDRSGDILITDGIDLKQHRDNPVALFDHNRNAPIGRFESPEGNYTVRKRRDGELVGELFFNRRSQFAVDVFRGVDDGIFRGASIGFVPRPGMVIKRAGRGHIFQSVALVEASIVVIPDNPSTLVEAINKGLGGRPICKPLAAMLETANPWSSWEALNESVA